MIDFDGLAKAYPTLERHGDRFSITVSYEPQDVFRMVSMVLPYVVKLKRLMTTGERDVLNKTFEKESGISYRDREMTCVFVNDPVWDYFGMYLFFRSEADFVVALMFLPPGLIDHISPTGA